MIDRLRKKILNWLAKDKEIIFVDRSSSSREYNNLLSTNERSLTITIIPGSGGIAIEVNKYDPVKKDYVNSLHIVQREKSLVRELAKIITFEQL